MSVSAAGAVRFRLDRPGGRLLRLDADGAAVPIAIGSRALGVLCKLADRPGELVSKKEIMDAVWPDTIVEDKNLAVQVSALRQALEREGGQGHLIHTVPGRGYRLDAPLDEMQGPELPPPAVLVPAAAAPAWWRSPPVLVAMLLATALGLGGLVLALVPPGSLVPQAPRLSLIVLPFDNIDRAKELDLFVDSLTEDVKAFLARRALLALPAPSSAVSLKGTPVDIARIRETFKVRYALAGSVRKLGPSMHVTAHLVSTETGADLWADQFDAGAGQDATVPRISAAVTRELVDVESARGARERPGNPDATDALLQAISLFNRPLHARTQPQVVAMFELAVQRDPSSAVALAGLASALADLVNFGDADAPAQFERAELLLEKAEWLQPRTISVMATRMYLLRAEERWPEAVAAAQNFNDAFPGDSNGHYQLGASLLFTGRAAEAIPELEESIRLDPHSPALWSHARRLGQALLIAGRYDDAIVRTQVALATRPGAHPRTQALRHVEIAAAHALAGRLEEARMSLAEATRLWPFLTARGWWGQDETSPAFAAQLAQLDEALRRAGLRDHEEEDADFGIPSDDALPMLDEARTPTTVPGARNIRTTELVALLAERKLLVLDLSAVRQSIPGAIGLRGAGMGGTTSDAYQARLIRKMQELTHGDRSAPIVIAAWNANHFAGRNLALRLAALGYTDVNWYRGGREAWEVAGQPEAAISIQDW